MTQSITTNVAQFLEAKALTATQPWLETFASSARPGTPLPALQKTALFRLLATDITTSLKSSTSNCIPPNAVNVSVAELRLPGPIPVQILDIEDIGRSRWSQVEAIEAQERGETTKGREIIRVVPGDEGEGGQAAADAATVPSRSYGPHKLLLQDSQGTKIYGFEVSAVEGINLKSLAIGTKLVLKNATVARGVVLLEPSSTQVLGGKVEVWDKAWKAGRKEALKTKVGPPEERP